MDNQPKESELSFLKRKSKQEKFNTNSGYGTLNRSQSTRVISYKKSSSVTSSDNISPTLRRKNTVDQIIRELNFNSLATIGSFAGNVSSHLELVNNRRKKVEEVSGYIVMNKENILSLYGAQYAYEISELKKTITEKAKALVDEHLARAYHTAQITTPITLEKHQQNLVNIVALIINLTKPETTSCKKLARLGKKSKSPSFHIPVFIHKNNSRPFPMAINSLNYDDLPSEMAEHIDKKIYNQLLKEIVSLNEQTQKKIEEHRHLIQYQEKILQKEDFILNNYIFQDSLIQSFANYLSAKHNLTNTQNKNLITILTEIKQSFFKSVHNACLQTTLLNSTIDNPTILTKMHSSGNKDDLILYFKDNQRLLMQLFYCLENAFNIAKSLDGQQMLEQLDFFANDIKPTDQEKLFNAEIGQWFEFALTLSKSANNNAVDCSDEIANITNNIPTQNKL